jgi:class 3 adenylate cyclase
MTIAPQHLVRTSHKAWPLWQLYRRRVWPLLAVLVLSMAGLTWWGTQQLTTQLYLDLAARQAGAVLRSAQQRAPDDWTEWVADMGHPPRISHYRWPELAAAIDRGTAERQLTLFKVYDNHGILRYSTQRDDIGAVERSAALDAVLQTRSGLINRVLRPEGELNEMYVVLPADATHPGLIAELYEPANWLEHQLRRALLPAVGVPLVLLIVLMGVLTQLVRHAQRQLDAQASTRAALELRLASLVSRRAASSARNRVASTWAPGNADEAASVNGHLLDATLYFADVSAFTSYAETHTPQAVVHLLNQLIAIQVRHIHAQGGDVDKLIGDAVLAVFTGDDRAQRAVACAQAVLADCASHPDLPRQLHIGVHDGFMISGTLGTAERQDDTVIGDAVNLAARLCGQASPGQLVSDTATLARAGHPQGFGPVEEVRVKGRAEPVRLRRHSTAPNPPAIAVH